jgi:predicted nucleic acid-binding protein
VALILDTSALFASLDRSDSDYRTCRALIESATEPLVIPSPVLAEIDYLVNERLHSGVMIALFDDIIAGAYRVEEVSAQDLRRIRDLCERYEDADIGYVDAAVLAIVERFGEPKLATLDRRHFGTLRPRHVDSLRLLPE